MDEQRIPVPGSERPPAPGAQVGESVVATDRVEVTLVLRRRVELPEAALTGPALTSAELAIEYGADPVDVQLVRDVLDEVGVEVISVDFASRLMRIAGTVETLNQLFGTALRRAELPGQLEFRQRTGELSVPAQLSEAVTAVLGLDNRPQSQARFRIAPAATVSVSYRPTELDKVYSMPAGTDGTGQTLAIIELGGGFGQDDLDSYFSGLGLATPKVTAVGVDGARNVAGTDPSGADGEVLLDIEVSGALAPAASIVVYFAPNTDAGFLDAVSAAAHASPTPTAISISWGQSEDAWTPQARRAMDQAFADAAAMGVTVIAAAGDDGSSDRVSDAKAHVDYPAASAYVLGCGGTSLSADPATGAVRSEKVWNNGAGQGATGGGVSNMVALPSWQRTVGVPAKAGTATTGRGVPDVAANADPRTGYQVLVDGKSLVIGGTSAVAPLWAALVCRLAQSLGRGLGLLQPALYGSTSAGTVAPGFRDITSGDNGAYQAGPGWDACTGLGVPDGTALLAALQSRPVARPSPAWSEPS
jgi:kumamolisin